MCMLVQTCNYPVVWKLFVVYLALHHVIDISSLLCTSVVLGDGNPEVKSEVVVRSLIVEHYQCSRNQSFLTRVYCPFFQVGYPTWRCPQKGI